MKTAIFVDGSFFIKRLKFLYGNKPNFDVNDPKKIIDELMPICTKHLNEKIQAESKEEKRKYEQKHELYRIFFYDCPPIVKKAHYPVSNKALDFAKTPQASLRQAVHGELKKRRKTALKLGKLGSFGRRRMKSGILKDILNRSKNPEDLKDDDFYYDIRQKGVDMRIGIDIASVAYKKQAERIVLISGDSDFVPAAKLARREGIDFILDPMYAPVADDLFEHIDGLWSACWKDKKK